MEYAEATRETVREVFLVHGEGGGAERLREKLGEAGMKNVRYPEPASTVEI